MKLTRVQPMLKRADGEFEIVPWNESPTNEYELTWCNPLCRFDRCILRIRKGDADQGLKRHGWNGDRDAPTITPSIGCEQRRCGWHGHITNGESNP